MVLVLLVCRLQNQLPLILEAMVALQFIVFSRAAFSDWK